MFADRRYLSNGKKAWRRGLFISVAATVLATASATCAQTAGAPEAVSEAKSPVKHIGMQKQPLAQALNDIGRQYEVEIIFDPAIVHGKEASALRGDFTVEGALARLLEGSNLSFTQTERGVYLVAIKPATRSAPTAGVPELIVTAHHRTLNTGILRTKDDTQPFVIFTREQIAQSGDVSLEQFFRDNLASDNSTSTADQGGALRKPGISEVDLRGLGSTETLILIDGRRVPGVSNFDDVKNGALGQTQIAGIPVNSIERIEVLASSASGIYGANAAGGVVNIILRRDYQGVSVSATGGGTFEGGGGNMRFDASGGTSLEDGKTKLSFSASYSKDDPLLTGQRDFLADSRAHVLSVMPNYYTTLHAGLGNTVLGASPNIQSTNGQALVLKNGTSLGSPITYLPPGYTAAAGFAPLIADAGQYNLALAPTNDGAGMPLLTGTKTWSGNFMIDREFTPWLRGYISASASKTTSDLPVGTAPTTFTLSKDAPNNPFQQDIYVTAPQYGANGRIESTQNTYGIVTGVTVNLPYTWQAIVDVSANRNTYSHTEGASALDPSISLGILNGSIDIFQDRRSNPIPYAFLSTSNQTSPSISTGETLSLRLAGPIPLTLPGGEPVVTLLAEHDGTWLGGLKTINAPPSVTALPPYDANFNSLTVNTVTLADIAAQQQSAIFYSPNRSQTTDSFYGEMRIPIVGASNHVPLIQSLELLVAGRYDRYVESAQEGSSFGFPNDTITCVTTTGSLTAAQLAAPCPPPGQALVTGHTARATVNPTVSMKWQINADVAIRASYATGFLPPRLNQLSPSAPLHLNTGLFNLFGLHYFQARDPLRGNEFIGSTVSTVTYQTGGNPNVRPETNASFSGGLIFTPHWTPGLRLSADWTHIAQKNFYFFPATFITGAQDSTTQAAFNAFLAQHPERFVRGAPANGFAVGPIIGIDASIANGVASSTDVLDVEAEYTHLFEGKGALSFVANATYVDSLLNQYTPGGKSYQLAGVVSQAFSGGGGGGGGVRLKGNARVNWSTDKWSIGLRARYYGSYYFDPTHTLAPAGQGSSSVPEQVYFDLFGTYKLSRNSEIRVVINDVLNTAPPLDLSNGNGYSLLGDPKKGNFYVTFAKQF